MSGEWKRLLVAVDVHAAPRRVLEPAVGLAKRLNAAVWLLHVAEPDPDFVGRELDPEVMRDAVAHEFREEHRELQRLSQELRGEGLECTALLVQGPAEEKILSEARRLAVDLIVVGSSGKSGVMRFLFGSTIEGVLQGASIPVLLIPHHESPASSGQPGQ